MSSQRSYPELSGRGNYSHPSCWPPFPSGHYRQPERSLLHEVGSTIEWATSQVIAVNAKLEEASNFINGSINSMYPDSDKSKCTKMWKEAKQYFSTKLEQSLRFFGASKEDPAVSDFRDFLTEKYNQIREGLHKVEAHQGNLASELMEAISDLREAGQSNRPMQAGSVPRNSILSDLIDVENEGDRWIQDQLTFDCDQELAETGKIDDESFQSRVKQLEEAFDDASEQFFGDALNILGPIKAGTAHPTDQTGFFDRGLPRETAQSFYTSRAPPTGWQGPPPLVPQQPSQYGYGPPQPSYSTISSGRPLPFQWAHEYRSGTPDPFTYNSSHPYTGSVPSGPMSYVHRGPYDPSQHFSTYHGSGLPPGGVFYR